MGNHGRPPITFNQEYSDILCSEIATTPESLAKIVGRLQDEVQGFPCVRTIYTWLRENETFAAEYTRAKSDQTDLLIDDLLLIADDSEGDDTSSTAVQRSKLRCDVRKFIASKLKPQKYGDRLDISGTIDHQHSVKALFDSVTHQASLLGCVQGQPVEHEDAEI